MVKAKLTFFPYKEYCSVVAPELCSFGIGTAAVPVDTIQQGSVVSFSAAVIENVMVAVKIMDVLKITQNSILTRKR